MNIAVLLAIHTASKRLPHKVLRQIGAATVLEQTVLRLQRARRPSAVIICTSTSPIDDIVVDIAGLHGWPCFRGSADDVLERYYEAAKEHALDLIVRAQGDNMFVCPEHIDLQIDKHLDAGADWSVVDGLPWGMKSEVITFAALKRCYLHAEDTSMSEYMTWFFDQPEVFRTLHIEADAAYRRPDYRVTMDTPEDLVLIREICSRFDKPPAQITTSEVIALLDAQPELVEVNARVPDRIGDRAVRAKVNTRILSTPRSQEVPRAREPERRPVYIVAEIGQNHNGDMDIARKLIDMAAMPIVDYFTGETLPGIDAVKFTKRDLAEELTEEAGSRPYTSPHSFGPTYLEHRRVLELSVEQHAELEQYARSKGLGFIETLCSPGCIGLLDRVRVDAVKVASRDVTNVPLLEALGEL